MPEAKHKKTASKVFDVAKPGKSAPGSNARPLIVSSGPIMKDPMVVDTSSEQGAASDAPASAPSARKIVLQPINQIDLSELAGPPQVDEKAVSEAGPLLPLPDEIAKPEEAAEADTASAKAEPDPTSADEASEKDDDQFLLGADEGEAEQPAEAEQASSDTDAADSTEDQPEAAPAEEYKPNSDEAIADLPLGEDAAIGSTLSEEDRRKALAAQKLQEEQDKIIAAGTYYLPINAAQKRRSKRRIVLGALLILALLTALALAAWDAGFFSVPGYAPLTDYL